jgi:hypothetical protein
MGGALEVERPAPDTLPDHRTEDLHLTADDSIDGVRLHARMRPYTNDKIRFHVDIRFMRRRWPTRRSRRTRRRGELSAQTIAEIRAWQAAAG